MKIPYDISPLPTDPGAIVVGLALDDPTPGQDCGIPGCPGSLADQVGACELCGGTGWASFPDPFLDGDLIDAACRCRAEPAR